MRNESLDAVVAELQSHGIGYTLAMGGKHPQVRFSINGGREHIFSFAGTSSNWCQPLNARQRLRRKLREIGGIDDEPKAPPAPPKQPDRLTALERSVAALVARVAALEGS